MKAIVATQYGGPEVLQLKEVETPKPKASEILIKIHATTVTAADFRMRSFTVPPLLWIPARLALGITKPRQPIFGSELAGELAAIGTDVTRFKVGDQVFGSTLEANFGAYAEYKCIHEKAMIIQKPDNITYEEATALPIGATTALRLLKKGNIQKGQHVMVYGASGSVGTYAIQLAKHFGANATGVSSTANLELVKSLGADKVIDYTQTDFSSHPVRYDFIFDTVGKFSKEKAKNLLAPNGKFISIANLDTKEHMENLMFICDLVKAGKLKAVIDRRYPLENIVEAHRYMDMGRKKGNIVITLK